MKRTVEAEEIVLKDESGKTRVSLSVQGNNSVAMKFFDEGGTCRTAMGIRENGTPCYDLFGEDGSEKGKFQMLPTGEVGISLHDSEVRTIFGLERNGTPSFSIYNPEGERQVQLTMKGGGPHLAFYDRTGNIRSLYGVGEDSTSYLAFFDRSNQPIVELSTDTEDVVRLKLVQKDTDTKAVLMTGRQATQLVFDKGGRPRFIVGVTDEGEPMMLAMNEKGQIIFSAP